MATTRKRPSKSTKMKDLKSKKLNARRADNVKGGAVPINSMKEPPRPAVPING